MGNFYKNFRNMDNNDVPYTSEEKFLLKELMLGEDPEVVIEAYLGDDEVVKVPERVTIIGEYAFANNRHLKRVILPDNVLYIGMSAFARCLVLREVNMPHDISWIFDYAFYKCVSLESVRCPICNIMSSAFDSCDNLKSFEFYDVAVDACYFCTLDDRAFAWCGKLERMEIPDRYNSIGAGAFDNCDSLTELILPGRVDIAGNELVRNCEKVTVSYREKKYTYEEYIKEFDEPCPTEPNLSDLWWNPGF